MLNILNIKRSFVSFLMLAALMGTSDAVLGMDVDQFGMQKGKRVLEREEQSQNQPKRKAQNLNISDDSSEGSDTDDDFCRIGDGFIMQKGKRLGEEEDGDREGLPSTKKANDGSLMDDDDADVEFCLNMLADCDLEKTPFKCSEKNAPRPINDVRLKAENGDPSAAYELGIRYLDGEDGAEKDYLEATRWLLRAGDYQDGKEIVSGIRRRLTEMVDNAMYLEANYAAFERVALEGRLAYKENAYTLGLIYWNGYGVIPSLFQARDYFQKADGYKDSQNYLSRIQDNQ